MSLMCLGFYVDHVDSMYNVYSTSTNCLCVCRSPSVTTVTNTSAVALSLRGRLVARANEVFLSFLARKVHFHPVRTLTGHADAWLNKLRGSLARLEDPVRIAGSCDKHFSRSKVVWAAEMLGGRNGDANRSQRETATQRNATQSAHNSLSRTCTC